MKKILAILLLLVLVVSISGCVEGGGFAGLLGVGVREEEAPNDVLAKKKARLVPSPPVPANSDFTLTFYLENLMSTEEMGQVQEAKDVDVEIYDTGRCDLQEDVTPAQALTDATIFPGGTKIIRWEFTAPSNQDLGNMAGQCPLRYKVEYDYSASTRADAIVASKAKIEEVSRTGESIQVSPSESKGRGPIKIDVRFGDQPFIAKEDGSALVPFNVIVKNKGQGEIKGREIKKDDGDGSIEKNELRIKAPDGDVEVQNCKYPEAERTPFIGKNTPSILCELKVSERPSPAPLKTYTIKTDLTYRYMLNYKETVSVEPTYQGVTEKEGKPKTEGGGQYKSGCPSTAKDIPDSVGGCNQVDCEDYPSICEMCCL